MATIGRLSVHRIQASFLSKEWGPPQLADDPRFWALCGLPPGAYDLKGFAVGVPASTPPAKPRPTAAEATFWLG